jgi:hypothetical protein
MGSNPIRVTLRLFITCCPYVEIYGIIKLMEYHEQFEKSPIARTRYGEKKDCTVMTLAYAMETDYSKAHSFLKRYAGRKDCRGVSMYQALTKNLEFIELSFGKKLEEVKFWWSQKDNHRRRPTLRKLVNELGPEMYIVTISGHAFVIHNNKIIDTSQPPPGCRAIFIWKVDEARE